MKWGGERGLFAGQSCLGRSAILAVESRQRAGRPLRLVVASRLPAGGDGDAGAVKAPQPGALDTELEVLAAD
jgi:hypothetical protein